MGTGCQIGTLFNFDLLFLIISFTFSHNSTYDRTCGACDYTTNNSIFYDSFCCFSLVFGISLFRHGNVANTHFGCSVA